MSLILPHQLLIANLEGRVSRQMRRIYIGKAKALKLLRNISDQDFGEDAKAWAHWIGAHKDEFYEAMRSKELAPPW